MEKGGDCVYARVKSFGQKKYLHTYSLLSGARATVPHSDTWYLLFDALLFDALLFDASLFDASLFDAAQLWCFTVTRGACFLMLCFLMLQSCSKS